MRLKEGTSCGKKTKEAFRYVYNNHRHEADWFLKADDDTYVLVDNLKDMLKYQNTSEPVYFGHTFKKHVPQGYMSGGAGYVLSEEALHRFVTSGLEDMAGNDCREDGGGAEDVELGWCMEGVGVKVGDSRDQMGRDRFFPLHPFTHLYGDVPDWFLEYTANPVVVSGMDCCSDTAISFHAVDPDMMYLMDHFLYHFRPVMTKNETEETLRQANVDSDMMNLMEYLIYHLRPVNTETEEVLDQADLDPDMMSEEEYLIYHLKPVKTEEALGQGNEINRVRRFEP